MVSQMLGLPASYRLAYAIPQQCCNVLVLPCFAKGWEIKATSTPNDLK